MQSALQVQTQRRKENTFCPNHYILLILHHCCALLIEREHFSGSTTGTLQLMERMIRFVELDGDGAHRRFEHHGSKTEVAATF